MRATRPLAFGTVVFAVVLASACSSSSSGGSDTTQGGGPTGTGGSGTGGSGTGGSTAMGGSSATGGSGGGSTTAACTESGDLDLAGTWLTLVRFDTKLENQAGSAVALCPADQNGPAEFLAIVNITQSGTTLTAVQATVCDFTLPQVTAIVGACQDPSKAIVSQVTPSPALKDSLPSLKLSPVTGMLGGTTPGSALMLDAITTVLGSNATDPTKMAHWNTSGTCDSSTAPMGTSNDCATMCVSDCSDAVDTDGDGSPAVTFYVCGQAPSEPPGATCQNDDPSQPGITLQGKAFVNFEVNPKLSGKADSSCQLSGTADASIVYNIIGADVYLEGGPITVETAITSIPQFQVQPATSKFLAVRVDGKHGSTDLALGSDAKAACMTAISKKSSVFH